MEDIHLKTLETMINMQLNPKSRENLEKWAEKVSKCVEHRDIIVVYSSQNGDDEAETGMLKTPF